MVKVKMPLKTRSLQAYTQETATDYEIRIEQVNNTTYWVVPVVMMVEGVHNGSRGPLLYSEEELANSVSGWNGIPVTIGHPKDENQKFISANLPGVFEDIVGRVYNPRMDDGKLKAEAWVDITAMGARSAEALEYLQERRALDVSIGVFSKEKKVPGEWNGEEYRAEAYELEPDHLALLPGEVGACSWDDGCGIRNNSKDKKMKTNTKDTRIKKADFTQAFAEQGLAVKVVENFLTGNASSFNDIMSAVYAQLNSMDNESAYYYMEEIYDSYVVYCTTNRKSGEKKMFKQAYSINEAGAAEFTGDPVRVKKKVSYAPVTEMKRTNFNTKSKTEMKNNGKCTCTVDSLIDNEATNFTEDDRDWLSELPQEQLNKLAPKEQKPATPAVNKKTVEPAKEGESLVKKNEDGSISINGKSLGAYIKEELGKETDPLKFIDNMFPDGLKDQMKAGLSMYQSRRGKMIKEIVASSKFKEDQLKNWADADLSALHESLIDNQEEPTGNYAPMTGGSLEEGGEEEGSESEISAMVSFATPKAAKVEEKKK